MCLVCSTMKVLPFLKGHSIAFTHSLLVMCGTTQPFECAFA